MTKLGKLKDAKDIHDLAYLLGFKASAVAYLVYKLSPASKYTTFTILKASGGERLIEAPVTQLKKLQRRLADLLQDCLSEVQQDIGAIHKVTGKQKHISHGFRKDCSIMTNAASHRARRYVFNIDLENFFGEINFGRVRGYFISNKYFALHQKVATLIAQIACHNNHLPQGAPTSPIISNLIAGPLDIRLASLAGRTGCTYSRYADDLSFSTNKASFPDEIAVVHGDAVHTWVSSKELQDIITRSGFRINQKKTRMQYSDSRQEVTGIIINKKVNVKSEYQRLARSMVHSLRYKGYFVLQDAKGELKNGTIRQLDGILSFIDQVRLFDKMRTHPEAYERKCRKFLTDKTKPPLDLQSDSFDRTYRKFLFYKNFIGIDSVRLVFEGKTDGVYIDLAIKHNAPAFPSLARVDATTKSATRTCSIFKYSEVVERVLGVNGGGDQLVKILKEYQSEVRKLKPKKGAHPLIVVVDNDDGAKPVIGYLNNLFKTSGHWMAQPYIHLFHDAYVVPIPNSVAGGSVMIEDLFDPILLTEKVDGKTFNPSNVGLDINKEYGKSVFANQVVKKKHKTIRFEGFIPLLKNIELAIQDHKLRAI